VTIIFTVTKPKSAPKKRQTWPGKKPDIDKLCRSTLDGLVTAGVIEDDARVIVLNASKAFPGEHPDSLDVPGAVIRIEPIGTR
jgi:Holliday junction resolvase RusA-like endonuclease